jgi:hypothetical protein
MARPEISTDPISLDVTAGFAVTVRHGLGRQVVGWQIIWKNAAVDFFEPNPAADTRAELVLMPTATAKVRLVLF